MATFEHIVNVLTDCKIPQDFKDALIKEEEITENEILGLIDWYVNKRSWDGSLGFEFDSQIKDGYKVDVVLKKRGGQDGN